MKLTSVIIEDEGVAARRLQRLIEKNEVEVLAVLTSVTEAVSWLKLHSNNLDLIFLDIQLGDGISFEIFEEIQPKSAIIFTTAYEDYAIKAFKLNSIDYLLKPINEKELTSAIAKFKSGIQAQVPLTASQIQQLIYTNFEQKYKERFLVEIGMKMKTIETQNINFIFSENKATFINSESRNYLINNSLDELENQIDPHFFFRINRQCITNLQGIKDITSYSGNRLSLKLNGSSEEWIVSRERVSDFKNWLAQ